MTFNEATILLVEDEPQLLKIFGAWLTREGSRVLLAHNGAEGLKLAEQNHLDLVISDIRMPVMDGIELARHLSKRRGYLPTILFVSGFGDIEDRNLYEIGVARKLPKPLRRQELVEAARFCLSDKDERWGTPPRPEEGTIDELVIQASETIGRTDWISFGHGGFCLRTDVCLPARRLVRLHLTNELDTPAVIVAVVRWFETAQRIAGFEIRHVDPIGRAAVIRVTDNVGVNAFIPHTLGLDPTVMLVTSGLASF